MDAKELEKGINEKYGRYKDFEIDENFRLIRTLETGDLVIMDLKSPGNGHHLLKDATEKEIEKISGYFQKLTEKENENELIPSDTPDSLTPEQQRQQEKENELIPDDNEEGKSGDNDLIPD